MYCSNCGSEIEKEDIFCPGCGIKLKKGKTKSQSRSTEPETRDTRPSTQETGLKTQDTKPRTRDTGLGMHYAGPKTQDWVQDRRFETQDIKPETLTQEPGTLTAGKSFLSGPTPWVLGVGGIILVVGAVILFGLLLLLLFVPGNQPSTQTAPQTGGTQFPATTGQQPAPGTQQPVGGGGTWGTQQPTGSPGSTQQAATIDQNLYGDWIATSQGKRMIGFSVRQGAQQGVCVLLMYGGQQTPSQAFPCSCTSQSNVITMNCQGQSMTIPYQFNSGALYLTLSVGSTSQQIPFQKSQTDLLNEAGISITKGPGATTSNKTPLQTNTTFILPANWSS